MRLLNSQRKWELNVWSLRIHSIITGLFSIGSSYYQAGIRLSMRKKSMKLQKPALRKKWKSFGSFLIITLLHLSRVWVDGGRSVLLSHRTGKSFLAQPRG